MFVLIMQFVWKYIDDMLGKGLEWQVIAKLLFYICAGLVPMALPLAVLLSSLMTFGNLGENNELTAFKAAGISLQRVMKPLIVTSVFLSITAFLFANYLLPVANLKGASLLYDIQKKKPAVNIKPGIFYNEIENTTIRIKNKTPHPKGEMLQSIMIYDHTNNRGNTSVTVADSGIMYLSDDNLYLHFLLYNGAQYEDNLEEVRYAERKFPFTVMQFKENHVKLDLSAFKLNRTDEELFKENVQMMNMRQLSQNMDSIIAEMHESREDFLQSLKRGYRMYADSNLKFDKPVTFLNFDSLITALPLTDQNRLLADAENHARSMVSKAYIKRIEFENRRHYFINHQIEWHKKLTFSSACIVLFFIGAPLGAIIRKGGLGMPVVVSVAAFLVYYILMTIGEQMTAEEVLPPYIGMWLATLFFVPLCIFITKKAVSDAALFNADTYLEPVLKLLRFKFKLRA
jgi:lipopolysaccharide export system permease protein